MNRVRALPAIAGTLGVTLLLAACAGNPTPADNSSSSGGSGSPSNTASPSPSPSLSPSMTPTVPATEVPGYKARDLVTAKSLVTSRIWPETEHVLTLTQGSQETEVVATPGITTLTTDSEGNQALTVTGRDAGAAEISVAVIGGDGYRQNGSGQWTASADADTVIDAALPTLPSVVDEKFLKVEQQDNGDLVFGLRPDVVALLDGEPVTEFERTCVSTLMSDALDMPVCVVTVNGVLLQEVYWQRYDGILTPPVLTPDKPTLPDSFPNADQSLSADEVGAALKAALPSDKDIARALDVADATVTDGPVRSAGGVRIADAFVVAGEVYLTVSAMAMPKAQLESMLNGYRSGGAEVSVDGDMITVVFPGDKKAGTIDAASVYRATDSVVFVVSGAVPAEQAQRMLDLLS